MLRRHLFADRIRRLHEAGVILDAEHEVSKRKLLGLEVHTGTESSMESKEDRADSSLEVQDEKM